MYIFIHRPFLFYTVCVVSVYIFMLTDIITCCVPTGCPVASPQINFKGIVLEILMSRKCLYIYIYLNYVLFILLFHGLS